MISEDMKEQVSKSSVIRQMFEEGKRLEALFGANNVYDFSLGNPNVLPPASINETIKNVVESVDPVKLHGYMNNAGHIFVREKIASFLNEKYETNFTYENICMCVGAAGGLNVILKSILNKDDEVIIIAPFFGEYRAYISNYSGKMVVVNSKEDDFHLDFDNIKNAFTSKTKAVIINTPNNPTGVIYTKEELEKLSEILREKEKKYGHSIALISDEPYREIVYNGEKLPYLTNLYDNTFVCYSYSKSLSLAGERIGYIAISSKMSDFSNVSNALATATRTLGFVNAPSLMQMVIASNVEALSPIEEYKINRDLIYSHLKSLGFSCIKPEGAFYLFIKVPDKDEKRFCELAKEKNILLVPGTAFGITGYVRLAYCVKKEVILNSFDAFKSLAKEYGR